MTKQQIADLIMILQAFKENKVMKTVRHEQIRLKNVELAVEQILEVLTTLPEDEKG